MEQLSTHFVSYLHSHLNLSEDDQKKIKYVVQLILGDLSKFLILLCLFSFFGVTLQFLWASAVLFCYRPFTGGLHFKTYWGCFSFSLVFFSAVFLCNKYVALMPTAVIFLYALCILMVAYVGPLPSESRPKYSAAQIHGFKTKAIFVIGINLMLFLLIKNNPYSTLAFWVILIQTIQIIIKKGGLHYEIQRSCKNPR